jgi:uncharacterized phage protein (TIGR02218 family)
MALDLTATGLKLTELYLLTLAGNLTLPLTSYSSALTYDSITFNPAPLRRSEAQYAANLQVDRMDVELGIVGLTIGGNLVSIPSAVRRGLFRNARVRVLLVDPVALSGHYTIFDGYVAEGVSYTEGILSLKVSSVLDRLQERFPKLIYSEQCQHRLYDTRCGLVRGDWQESGIVLTGSSKSVIKSTVFQASSHAAPYWFRGSLTFTSGANDGQSVTILNHRDGEVDLLLPCWETPAIGDTFTVLPGCDHLGTTCQDKFDNYDHFFGFEYIPRPEVLQSDLRS